MVIRISGIVSIARTTQQRLQQGIPEGDRAAFLRGVRDHVRGIEMIFDDHAASPRDLPAPSRRAYAVLQDVLGTPPDDLPLPAPGPEPAPQATVRVSRIVGTLDRVLAGLSQSGLGLRAEGRESIERATNMANSCVEQVRLLCAEQGGTPAALPKRSGQAFGMLAWLTEPDHVEQYVAQHDMALQHFEPIVRERFPHRHLRITFEPGRHIYALRTRGSLARFKLSVAFLTADLGNFLDLAAVCVPGGDPADAVLQRHAAFLESEPATALQTDLYTLWHGVADRPQGRAYDLDRLFRRLNEHFFEGRMQRPRLEWRASLSRTRFGFFRAASDLVVIDARLDDPSVPEFVAECVLFHELLHKHYGTPHARGRRQVHPPHFRRHERMHPRFPESDRWLEALAMGQRAPAEEDDLRRP